MLEMQYWKTAFLEDPTWTELGITGSFKGGWYEDELTLIAFAEDSSGKLTDLNYAI